MYSVYLSNELMMCNIILIFFCNVMNVISMLVVDHLIRVVVPRIIIVIANVIFTLVPKPGTVMATGGGLVLPEPLHDEDLHSWFKRFEVCVAPYGWDEVKKLQFYVFHVAERPCLGSFQLFGRS